MRDFDGRADIEGVFFSTFHNSFDPVPTMRDIGNSVGTLLPKKLGVGDVLLERDVDVQRSCMLYIFTLYHAIYYAIHTTRYGPFTF